MMFFPFRLRYTYLKPVYATITILFLMILVFILQLAGTIDHERWGLMNGVSQPERILMHSFLHGGVLHLLVNAAAFVVFAQIINAALGWALFLLVCTACATTSAALELLLDHRLYLIPSIGMSGVIGGLVVLSCFWLPRVKVTFVFWFVLMFGFIDFAIWGVAGTWVLTDAFRVLFTNWEGQGVAYWGHLGGFAGGFLCFLVCRAFGVAELTGFFVAPARKASRRRLFRRLQAARKDTARPEAPAMTATCLRCGFPSLLKEPPGKKGLRCRHCGQSSRQIRETSTDPALRKSRLAFGFVLGGITAALFVVCWLVMRPPITMPTPTVG